MRSDDILSELGRIRQGLCREYQLTGHDEERTALGEAIAAISVAEERIGRFAPSPA